MSRLKLAIRQITDTRNYTRNLLDHVEREQWFFRPSPGTNPVAWQVGHLAMAEYRLTLERIRGKQPSDETLISTRFLKQFGKGSVPSENPSDYPSPKELLAVMDRVHQQAMKELHDLPDDQLDLPPLAPHPLFDTKLGALLWCGQHEMLHAGQIGMLRRMAGHEALW